MQSLGLVDSFSEFKEFKNIDRATMMRVLEDVFRSMLRKKYGTDENFDIIINDANGDLEIWRNRMIVPDGEVTDSLLEIGYSDAINIEPDFEVGEEAIEEVKLETFWKKGHPYCKADLNVSYSRIRKRRTIQKIQRQGW